MATAMAVAGVMDGVFGGGEEATTAGEGASTVGEGASTAGEGASSSATTPSPTTATSAGGASQAASDGTRSILEMSTLEKFQHHLPRTALNMGTATSCHMAVEGKAPSAKGLVQNAVQALAQSMAHTCANEVGGWYGNNRVDVVSHKLLHAALGAGLGAAVSKNRTEGAIVGAGSAMAAELIAEMMGPSTVDLQSKARAGTLTHDDIEAYWEQVNDTADAARILTAGAVALSGKDAETAVTTSNNALDNNFLEAAYAAAHAHDKPLTEEQRQAGEEFLFDDVALLQSLKEVVEGPARDRIEYVLDRLQQDSLNLLEVPGLIALLKSSAEEFIAAQFIPTSRFDVALEGASLVTLGMGKVLPMGMKLLRTLQSEKFVVRALSSFTSRTSAHVGLRGAQHVGGEVAHLSSPSGFGAKFKKSVGFADDIGAPLEFRATFDKKKAWKATREKGTRQTYSVYQRKDIDWNMIRTKGDKRFISKTNAEAARSGLAPELEDGYLATLHHLGQDARGPLVEASTRYHGVGKSGQKALHGQWGKNAKHPHHPVDHKRFKVDDREYWKHRVPKEK